MAKSKPLLDFIRLPIPQKIEYGRDRVDNMTGNANFPTPSPTLAVVTTATDDLEQKHLAAQGGGPADTIAQEASEAAWDDLMRKLAAYVDGIADGDPVIISSAGFAPSKTETTPVQPPEKPTGLTLEQTPQSGTVISNCDPVKEARAYVTLISESPDFNAVVDDQQLVITPGAGNIIIHFSVNRKGRHANLRPGARYYVKKYAINAAGRGPDSDANSMMVV